MAVIEVDTNVFLDHIDLEYKISIIEEIFYEEGIALLGNLPYEPREVLGLYSLEQIKEYISDREYDVSLEEKASDIVSQMSNEQKKNLFIELFRELM